MTAEKAMTKLQKKVEKLEHKLNNFIAESPSKDQLKNYAQGSESTDPSGTTKSHLSSANGDSDKNIPHQENQKDSKHSKPIRNKFPNQLKTETEIIRTNNNMKQKIEIGGVKPQHKKSMLLLLILDVNYNTKIGPKKSSNL